MLGCALVPDQRARVPESRGVGESALGSGAVPLWHLASGIWERAGRSHLGGMKVRG